MQIILNTDELSDTDRQVLALLSGEVEGVPTKTSAPAAKPSPRSAKQPEPTPDPEPEDEPAEEATPSDAYTQADAVARATELVQGGKSADVKAALAKAGSKKVSELDEDGIQVFMAELA